jgi:hypothetical protein
MTQIRLYKEFVSFAQRKSSRYFCMLSIETEVLPVVSPDFLDGVPCLDSQVLRSLSV